MKLKIKRIDKSLPLPSHDKGASCFDFVCRKSVKIKPKEIALVPTNSVIKIPEGYTLLVFSRSSTPLKKGLILANSVGVLDSFYCGDKDEIMLMFYNITKKSVIVNRGEHLAQGMVVEHEEIIWDEVEKMPEKGRGGYNSDFNRKDKKK